MGMGMGMGARKPPEGLHDGAAAAVAPFLAISVLSFWRKQGEETYTLGRWR